MAPRPAQKSPPYRVRTSADVGPSSSTTPLTSSEMRTSPQEKLDTSLVAAHQRRQQHIEVRSAVVSVVQMPDMCRSIPATGEKIVASIYARREPGLKASPMGDRVLDDRSRKPRCRKPATGQLGDTSSGAAEIARPRDVKQAKTRHFSSASAMSDPTKTVVYNDIHYLHALCSCKCSSPFLSFRDVAETESEGVLTRPPWCRRAGAQSHP